MADDWKQELVRIQQETAKMLEEQRVAEEREKRIEARLSISVSVQTAHGTMEWKEALRQCHEASLASLTESGTITLGQRLLQML